MRVDLLCSGSKGNCCIIRHKDTQLMIDCGSTKKYLTQAFMQAGVKKKDLDAVLITHTHKDHVAQLKHFRDLPIYSYCDLEDCSQHRIVRPLSQFDVKDLHIRVIGLSHDAPKTVGYVLETSEEKLVYITDTGYIPNHEKKYMENADYYIFESNHDVATLMKTRRPMFVKQRILGDSGHLNNEDASSCLTGLINTNTKKIVLAHLSEEANNPEMALDVLQNTFLKRDLPYTGIDWEAAGQHTITSLGMDLYNE
ncbi:MAG: MBL fold metallo-hydrolase [Erysipelotrichaceae bacterium]|jgi:phosphoribosyl 1,2-cyclic phosphodiesterase|nr:MBL fold metallo-hydrolase [Erysipelotrichaceae bacterium]